MATQNHGLGQQPDSRVTEEGKGKKSQARNGVLSIGQTEDPMSQSNAKLQKVVTFLLAFPLTFLLVESGLAAVTVTGKISLSARASKSIHVVSAQFQLDGKNLGKLDTSAPFRMVWNSNTASPGRHTITAITRDYLGNVRTASYTVIVADRTPPTTPKSLQVRILSSSNIRLSWKPAGDNVGVSSYRIYRNGVAIANRPMPRFFDKGLIPGTYYNYSVTALDSSGNESRQTQSVFSVGPGGRVSHYGMPFITLGQMNRR